APPIKANGEQLAALVAAENHLAAAVCPGMAAEDLEAAKAAAKANVDQRLASANWPAPQEAAAKLVAEASAQGTVDAASAKYLSAADQLALVRRSRPASRPGRPASSPRSSAHGRKASPSTSSGGLQRPSAWIPRAPPEPRSRTGSPPPGTPRCPSHRSRPRSPRSSRPLTRPRRHRF